MSGAQTTRTPEWLQISLKSVGSREDTRQSVEQLQRIVNTVQEDADRREEARPHLRMLFSVMEEVMLDSEFQVSVSCIQVLDALVTIYGHAIHDHIALFLPSLLEKFCHPKRVVVISLTMRFVEHVMRVLTPEPVLLELYSHAAHEAWRIRVGVLNLIIAALLSFPSTDFDCRRVATQLVGRLQDSETRVHAVAMELYAVLHTIIGDDVYAAIEDHVEAATLRTLRDRIDSNAKLPVIGVDGCVEHNKDTVPTTARTSRTSRTARSTTSASGRNYSAVSYRSNHSDFLNQTHDSIKSEPAYRTSARQQENEVVYATPVSEEDAEKAAAIRELRVRASARRGQQPMSGGPAPDYVSASGSVMSGSNGLGYGVQPYMGGGLYGASGGGAAVASQEWGGYGGTNPYATANAYGQAAYNPYEYGAMGGGGGGPGGGPGGPGMMLGGPPGADASLGIVTSQPPRGDAYSNRSVSGSGEYGDYVPSSNRRRGDDGSVRSSSRTSHRSRGGRDDNNTSGNSSVNTSHNTSTGSSSKRSNGGPPNSYAAIHSNRRTQSENVTSSGRRAASTASSAATAPETATTTSTRGGRSRDSDRSETYSAKTTESGGGDRSQRRRRGPPPSSSAEAAGTTIGAKREAPAEALSAIKRSARERQDSMDPSSPLTSNARGSSAQSSARSSTSMDSGRESQRNALQRLNSSLGTGELAALNTSFTSSVNGSRSPSSNDTSADMGSARRSPGSQPGSQPGSSRRRKTPSSKSARRRQSVASTGSSVGSRLGLNSQSEFLIASADLSPLHAPQAAYTSATNGFDDQTWEDQASNLNLLRALVLFHGDVLADRVADVIIVIDSALNNLRSQVSRVAIVAIEDVFTAMPREFEAMIEVVVPGLLKRAGASDVFMRDESVCTLNAMALTAHKRKFVTALLAAASSKNKGIRATVADVLVTVLENWGQKVYVSRNLTDIVGALAKLTSDRTPEARASACAALRVMQSIDDAAFSKALDTNLSSSEAGSVRASMAKSSQSPTRSSTAGSRSRRAGSSGSTARSVKSSSGRRRTPIDASPLESVREATTPEPGADSAATTTTTTASDGSGRTHSFMRRGQGNNLGYEPSSGSNSPATKRRPPELDVLPAIHKNLTSREWKERIEGVEAIVQLTSEIPHAMGEPLWVVRNYDPFWPLLSDGNSRVRVAALDGFATMVGLVGDGFVPVLDQCVVALASCLAASSPSVRTKSEDLFAAMAQYMSPSALVPSFVHQVKLGNVKIRIALTNILCGIIPAAHAERASVVERLVMPVALAHVGDRKGGVDAINSTNALLVALCNAMGPESFSAAVAAANLSAEQQRLVDEAVGL